MVVIFEMKVPVTSLSSEVVKAEVDFFGFIEIGDTKKSS